jgi:hypothetical protein
MEHLLYAKHDLKALAGLGGARSQRGNLRMEVRCVSITYFPREESKRQ